MAPGISLRTVTVVAFIVVLFWIRPDFTRFHDHAPSTFERLLPFDFHEHGHERHDFVKELLIQHKIGPNITFAGRRLRCTADAKQRLQNTEISRSLFPRSFRNTTIDQLDARRLGRPQEVHLTRSARPNEINASKLLFGTSTTPERFNDKTKSPLKEWVRWLTDGYGGSNGAKMMLALYKADDATLDRTSKTLAELGIDASVVHSNATLDMPGRYMDLVRLLWEEPTRSQRQYFGIVDDDTFFPAIDELQRVLSKYDPNKPYYLGTFTERHDWLTKNLLPMAYGGAGVFLTSPTIQQILSADCLAKDSSGKYILNSPEGDRLLYLCLHNKTEIALTPLHRLWQFDMVGDPSGFYESGHQPLSLHHFKTWHHFAPEQAHIVASACGEDCVFQKFQFSDKFVISNGYSVAEYPRGIDFDSLQYEGTFDYGGVDKDLEDMIYVEAFGMLRKKLSGTGRKRQWMLLGAKETREGRVKQVYVKRRTDERWVEKGVEKLPERDSVVVLEWVP
jgi:hypothetical protein